MENVTSRFGLIVDLFLAQCQTVGSYCFDVFLMDFSLKASFDLVWTFTDSFPRIRAYLSQQNTWLKKGEKQIGPCQCRRDSSQLIASWVFWLIKSSFSWDGWKPLLVDRIQDKPMIILLDISRKLLSVFPAGSLSNWTWQQCLGPLANLSLLWRLLKVFQFNGM